MERSSLELTDQEIAWLQNNSKRYLLNIKDKDNSDRVIEALKELCDKLDTPEEIDFNRQDLRFMQTIVRKQQIALNKVLAEYRRRGREKYAKYITKGEGTKLLIADLLTKIDVVI